MELAIDAILIFVAVFCIWAGARRGFIRSVMGLAGTVVSLFVAFAYTPALAPFFESRIMQSGMVGDIESVLHTSLDTTTDLFNLDATLTNLPGWFTDLLDRYHVTLDSVSGLMRGITGADDESLYNLSERIAYPTANVLSRAVAFVVLLVGAFIVMRIIAAILNAIFHMPVLSGANMFFGLLVGAVEGFVLISALALLFDVSIRAMGAFDASWFGDKAVDSTVLCRYLVEHNPLSFLLTVLQSAGWTL